MSFFLLDNIPIVGRSVEDLFGEENTRLLMSLCVSRSTLTNYHKYLDLKNIKNSRLRSQLQGVLHVFLGACIVELEHQSDKQKDWMDEFSDAMDTLQTSRGLVDLLNRTVIRMRTLTGFDRAMIYKFDDSWNGHVVAESVSSELEPYLDLHYPASDIPAQARELYRKNMVRYIRDVNYEPVLIEPWSERLQDSPLDMSYCLLRSISPVDLRPI